VSFLNTGHMLLAEQPEAVMGAIPDFLADGPV
jgi:hypothetical protein